MKKNIIIIFFLVFCFFSVDSNAELKNGPISISSDKATYIQKKNKVDFVGNVYVYGKDFKIYCDNMELILKKNIVKSNKLKKNKDSIKKMIATGKVHVILQGKEAFCKRAEYDFQSNYIILSGNVTLLQGNNKIMGDKLVIDLRDNKSEIFSNSTTKVHVIFFPQNAKSIHNATINSTTIH